MCLDVSEEQVRTNQVRIGKVRTGQVRTSQDRCLEGISGMFEWHMRCLDVSEGQVRTSQIKIAKVSQFLMFVKGHYCTREVEVEAVILM